MKDFVQWTAPSPLWAAAISKSTAGQRRAELSRPAILRFATDTFMDDFLKMTENDPKRLNQYIALPETWRGISPMPETLNPAPAFAKNFRRLGLIAARKKAKTNGLAPTTDKFTAFANSTAEKPLKLYQPAHQRFYMISACLVCERPGLPDKIPNAGREEKVTYVVRRLFPPKTTKSPPVNPKGPPDARWEEYAYVVTDLGARWKKVAKTDSLERDEEQQALFSVNILEDDGRRRKIFAGLIPTGRREAYIAAGEFSEKKTGTSSGSSEDEDPNAPIDSRVYQMRAQFRDPWRNLLQIAAYGKKAIDKSLEKDKDDGENVKARADIIKTSREQIQTVSWLILLDFANFLEKNMPRIWDKLNNRPVTPVLSTPEDTLVKVLENTTLDATFATDLKKETKYTDVSGSLKAALLALKPPNAQTAAQIEKNLETVVDSYNRNPPNPSTPEKPNPPNPPLTPNPPTPLYPNFLFPFADIGFSLTTVLDGGAPVLITPSNFQKTKINQDIRADAKAKNVALDDKKLIRDGEDYVNRIAKIIEEALADTPTAANQPLQMPPLASQKPLDMRQGWFVMRCVYERPLCGAIDPPVLSLPTNAFQIAGFFDPDAPARPIRIALPVDTTPAGLRKFDRNTAFMMSDLLCGQVNRMKGITFMDLVLSVLPFPFHKSLDVPDAGGCKDDDGLSIGMMCSLSIPIITICALILLMIIIALLDFIFKWLPFLIFCFPLPGLKAKDE
ncbi:MAG TPA: hypothetical protein VGC97_18060 [Pyrinomonadaceae bacterium]|jgi:hypothetical protein